MRRSCQWDRIRQSEEAVDEVPFDSSPKVVSLLGPVGGKFDSSIMGVLVGNYWVLFSLALLES